MSVTLLVFEKDFFLDRQATLSCSVDLTGHVVLAKTFKVNEEENSIVVTASSLVVTNCQRLQGDHSILLPRLIIDADRLSMEGPMLRLEKHVFSIIPGSVDCLFLRCSAKEINELSILGEAVILVVFRDDLEVNLIKRRVLYLKITLDRQLIILGVNAQLPKIAEDKVSDFVVIVNFQGLN